MNRIAFLCAGIVAFAAGITVGLLNRNAPPVELSSGTLLEPPRAIAPFEMGAPTGAFTNDDLEGQWSLLFFGFTRCPDICPTTLQLLADARGVLAAELPESDLPRIVLVSVDPGFDTEERLNNYTKFFGPAVKGVVGTPAQLAAFSEDLGVLYQKVPLGDEGYTMDHTGAVIVVSPQGQWRAVLSPPFDRDTIVNDLKRIIGAVS
jgi:protein SCO1/2